MEGVFQVQIPRIRKIMLCSFTVILSDIKYLVVLFLELKYISPLLKDFWKDSISQYSEGSLYITRLFINIVTPETKNNDPLPGVILFQPASECFYFESQLTNQTI